MNWNLIKSAFFKALPIALALIVGRGWMTQDQADQVPDLAAQVALALASAWTFYRSFKTHGT